eukprot:TRINITY_DN121797_c0_g1_i1.p1 TRINITY_DN121797_c0_g1~~TRINITY_DN121797_c0_g1_i1.p1  ORF type:complete len:984 (+),score=216.28 TRINITY_DN121797_c0_g1_i1:101-2953(+)
MTLDDEADALANPADMPLPPLMETQEEKETDVETQPTTGGSGATAGDSTAANGSSQADADWHILLTPAEERQRVSLDVEVVAGRHYYIISRRWMVEWLQWVGHHSVQSPKHAPLPDPGMPDDVVLVSRSPEKSDDSTGGMLTRQRSWTKERPGPIDNKSLLKPGDDSCLQPSLAEHTDYSIVSEEVWKLLHGWYGGGPAIKRRAIEEPSGGVRVELYGLRLQVYVSNKLSEGSTTMTESKTTTVEEFKKRACEEFGIDVEKARMWDYFNQTKYANLETSLHKTLTDCRIFEDNYILLEVQNADGTWPPEAQPKSTFTSTSYWGGSSGSYGGTSEDVATSGSPPQQGAAGLQNLGNTCFMNSSIQCLANVPQMRQFFLSPAYRDDLNDSAYKTKGKLAEAYAQLLDKMWQPQTVQVAPRNFKWQIGQFAEQFAGYGQQDSMEFIEYVLDGLKEDVNRIKGQKPFVELKEADGRPDEVVAQEARKNYCARNDSCIDELFLGFFKSTVQCPEANCNRVSVTFDPYLSVKLSLVSAADDRCTTFDVLLVPRESSPLTFSRQRVQVPKTGNAGDILEVASKSHGLEAKNCILTEVYSKKIMKFFEPTNAVEQIRSEDFLVLYELEDATDFQMSSEQRWGARLDGDDGRSAASGSADKCGIIIHHRQCRPSTSSYGYSYGNSMQLLGIPLIAAVNKKLAGSELLQAVRSELVKHFGDACAQQDAWRLYRTADKWNIIDVKTEVENDDSQLELDGGGRQYLVVEWKEGSELPERLAKLSEDTTSDSKQGRSKNEVSLFRCFEMFTETDKLSEMDTWYCNKCKEHREAYKTMEFWTMPPVLVVQLKRFTYTRYTRDRLDTAVSYPLEGLDLEKFCLQKNGSPQIYDCLAVSKHMGGLGGGHYVAYARNSENGKWYYYNDSSVTEVDAATVAEDQVGAYVLFYLRRDLRPAAWGPPANA